MVDYLPDIVPLEVAPLDRFHVTVVAESPLNTALSVTVLPLSPATLEGAVTRPNNILSSTVIVIVTRLLSVTRFLVVTR